jgi:hypothetical protein
MLYKVFKTSPKLEISQDKLRVYGLFQKRKELAIDQISEIDLFAIGIYNGSATIVTKIELLSGEIIKLAGPNYKNISEIKLSLVKYFPTKIKKANLIPEKWPISAIKEFGEMKFAGNPYTSFNALLMYGIAIGLIITTINTKKSFEIAHLFLIIPVAALFFGLSYQLNYFIFSEGQLIVKNHFLPWVNKQYEINDIIASNFEQGRKASRSLRITTKNFKSSNYQAGSLRDKDWNTLKEEIKKLGIHFIE